MSYNDILDLIANWFLNYASDNMQSAAIDTDGIARINGEFDLGELADLIQDEVA
jgi:hypothetical protein